MITKKVWTVKKWKRPSELGLTGYYEIVDYTGWYLFGIIPLYLIKIYHRQG